MQINGKTAVVTGGASGLGEAAARRLYAQGANIVLFDINDERGQAIEKELGEKVFYVHTDVTSVDSVKAAYAAAQDKFGAFNILVNAAGIGSAVKLVGKNGPMDPDHFKKIIDIDLFGVFNTMSNGAWLMSKNDPVEPGERGVIVNVSSVAGYEGQIGQLAYTAAKAAIIGMTITAARDLASLAIRVCTIAPGTMLTPLVKTLSEEVRESLAKQVPFPSRLGDPDEFAFLVQHIVENGYLNGETIRLDGAIRMGPR
jgi:3-hydroxyacyl-CoA dehydrogenase/3-hydroxy-2-methylbutyryl-CoA dehydrogenase